MPAVQIFDTTKVSDAFNNTSKKTFHFKQTYVANPRFAVGISALDANNSPTMAVKAFDNATDNTQYTANVVYGGNNIIKSAEMSSFIMRPADMAFQHGERTMVKDEGALTAGAEVKFERPYVTTPKVIVFLTAFDMATSTAYSIHTWASDVKPTGFTIHITAGPSTNIVSATASWIAFPEDCVSACCGSTSQAIPYEQKAVAGTEDLEELGNPINFTSQPDVFIALNQIEAETGNAVRIRTFVSDVDKKQLRWNLVPSGGDTRLTRVGVSYLAFTKDKAPSSD